MRGRRQGVRSSSELARLRQQDGQQECAGRQQQRNNYGEERELLSSWRVRNACGKGHLRSGPQALALLFGLVLFDCPRSLVLLIGGISLETFAVRVAMDKEAVQACSARIR